MDADQKLRDEFRAYKTETDDRLRRLERFARIMSEPKENGKTDTSSPKDAPLATKSANGDRPGAPKADTKAEKSDSATKD